MASPGTSAVGPVKYAERWRRRHPSARRSPHRAVASRIGSGEPMIPGVNRCPAVRLRQGKSGAKRADFGYLHAVAESLENSS